MDRSWLASSTVCASRLRTSATLLWVSRSRLGQSDPPIEGSTPVTDQTLQAMWNTIEHGGYDFMSKDDW
jgi:hypothetical protein